MWVPEHDLTPEARSELATYRNAVTWCLANEGDDSRLLPFRGRRIGGYLLLTDPEEIEERDDEGDMAFDQFYWDPGREHE